MPKFQVMKFVYDTTVMQVFEMASSFVENLWMPFIHPKEPVRTRCRLLCCVLINCCVQNIPNL